MCICVYIYIYIYTCTSLSLYISAPRTGGVGGAIAHRCHLMADLTSDAVV